MTRTEQLLAEILGSLPPEVQARVTPARLRSSDTSRMVLTVRAIVARRLKAEGFTVAAIADVIWPSPREAVVRAALKRPASFVARRVRRRRIKRLGHKKARA